MTPFTLVLFPWRLVHQIQTKVDKIKKIIVSGRIVRRLLVFLLLIAKRTKPVRHDDSFLSYRISLKKKKNERWPSEPERQRKSYCDTINRPRGSEDSTSVGRWKIFGFLLRTIKVQRTRDYPFLR